VTQRGFQCRQCGHCCINVSGAFSACATEADIERWEAAGRDDILAWVEPIAVGTERVYDLWIDPKTGDGVNRQLASARDTMAASEVNRRTPKDLVRRVGLSLRHS